MNLRLDNGMVKAQWRHDEGTSLMHSGKFRLNARLSAPYARLSFKHTLHGDILWSISLHYDGDHQHPALYSLFCLNLIGPCHSHLMESAFEYVRCNTNSSLIWQRSWVMVKFGTFNNVSSGLRRIVPKIMMFSILKYLFQSYFLAARATWDKQSGIPQNAPEVFCMFLNYQLH